MFSVSQWCVLWGAVCSWCCSSQHSDPHSPWGGYQRGLKVHFTGCWQLPWGDQETRHEADGSVCPASWSLFCLVCCLPAGHPVLSLSVCLSVCPSVSCLSLLRRSENPPWSWWQCMPSKLILVLSCVLSTCRSPCPVSLSVYLSLVCLCFCQRAYRVWPLVSKCIDHLCWPSG